MVFTALVWNPEGPGFLIPFFLGYDRVATTTGSLVDLRIDATSGQGYMPNASGTLVAATADVVSRAELGGSGTGTAAPRCIGSGAATHSLKVRLTAVVPAGNFFLRLGFTHSSGFSLSFNRTPVAVVKGSGTLLVPDNASVESSTLSFTVPRRARLCVTHADFEAPVAKGASTPVTQGPAPSGTTVPGGPPT